MVFCRADPWIMNEAQPREEQLSVGWREGFIQKGKSKPYLPSPCGGFPQLMTGVMLAHILNRLSMPWHWYCPGEMWFCLFSMLCSLHLGKEAWIQGPANLNEINELQHLPGHWPAGWTKVAYSWSPSKAGGAMRLGETVAVLGWYN